MKLNSAFLDIFQPCYVSSLMILVCSCFWFQSIEGQEPASSTGSKTEPGNSAQEAAPTDPPQKLRDTVERLRDTLKKVKIAEIAYMTGSFDESEGHNAAYEKAIAEGRKIKSELQDVAYPILLQSPTLDADMLELGRMLMYGLFDDFQYERSYQLATHLNKLSPNEDIQLMIMRSAMLTNRFEIAVDFREKVASKVQNIPKLELSMLKTIPDLIRIGTEERKLRDLDEQSNLPRVQFVTTEGTIVVELFEDQYPDTVGHFVFLVEKKFYNNLVFHRVTKNFLPFSVAQTGLFSLKPIPGLKDQAWFSHKIEYRIRDEKPKDGIVRRHLRGVLSLSSKIKDGKPIPDSGGSEFMITLVPSPALDGNQVAFGRVIEGLDVIDRFAPNLSVSEENGSEKPMDNPQFSTILEAKVLRKRDHEYLPNKVQ